MPQAYCFRCRDKIEINNPKKTTLKNGKLATEGTCPKCETTVFRIEQGTHEPLVNVFNLSEFT